MGWLNEKIIWEEALKFSFEVLGLSRKCNYLYGGLEKVIIYRVGLENMIVVYGGLENAFFCMGVSKNAIFLCMEVKFICLGL